jgi:hypothetical protein
MYEKENIKKFKKSSKVLLTMDDNNSSNKQKPQK